ncbi:hypothetical protein BH10PAT1_BH10PAT1_3010 [soil metagenome]
MKKISFIIILITVGILFRKFLISGPLVSGDAPYYYKEGLRKMLNFPSAWRIQGNALGNVNLFLFIYPLMVVYGILGTIFHFSNDLILRVLFYFPSLIFGFAGVYLFTKHLKFSVTTQFFAILIYLLNTYYLLIIDGGQVGVVLAYGLFPFVLFLLIKLSDKGSIKNFIFALLGSFILTIVDFRIAAICIFTALIFEIFEKKKIFGLFLISICLFLLSMYWIVPILKLATTGISTDIAGLQTTSLINSLFLFAPNWPANEFGKIIAPYFYFAIVPILIFLPLFFKKEKQIVWLTCSFLLFAFLAKGSTPPFGNLYNIFVNTKGGSVFRDSTKFFIPLILFGGILFGEAVSLINKRFFTFVIFIYILILIGPAMLGNLNGVLGKNINISDYQKIYNLESKDNNFSRSAWFDEVSPFSFSTNQKQALNAKDLVNFRPFASMNVGSGDRFNFINNKQYLDWFSLLGIKYLILNGNPRSPQLNDSDQKDWNRLLGLLGNDNRLIKQNIVTNIPIYKNENTLPNKFFVDKTFFVVGADDVYEKLQKLDNNFSVSNQGFLFLEDGKFDPVVLENVSSTSGIILFNNKTEKDLEMTFLQKYFVSPSKAYVKEWAVRNSDNFLNYKYELLQKDIDFHEFDYNQGIAFSSQANEKLNFSLIAPKDGDYYLEIRSLVATNSGNLKITFNQNQNEIKRISNNNFEWFEEGPINLKAGNYSLNLQNTDGFQVVNTVALIPASDIDYAEKISKNFMGNFEQYNLDKQDDQIKITKILEENKKSEYNDQILKSGWVIYTDSFNNNWQNSYPMFSMINGFYVDSTVKDFKIQFKGDEYVRWGFYFSVLSFLGITVVVLYKVNKNARKN